MCANAEKLTSSNPHSYSTGLMVVSQHDGVCLLDRNQIFQQLYWAYRKQELEMKQADHKHHKLHPINWFWLLIENSKLYNTYNTPLPPSICMWSESRYLIWIRENTLMQVKMQSGRPDHIWRWFRSGINDICSVWTHFKNENPPCYLKLPVKIKVTDESLLSKEK